MLGSIRSVCNTQHAETQGWRRQCVQVDRSGIVEGQIVVLYFLWRMGICLPDFVALDDLARIFQTASWCIDEFEAVNIVRNASVDGIGGG